MRIAVVHSYYHTGVPSGENVAVDAQVEALAAAGHEVRVVAQYSDVRLRRPSYPVEAAFSTVTGFGPDPTTELAAFAPDVVHVHNLFPNFGTRWLAAWPGPLVATLHNFRPMCAAGTLVRGGRRCTDCSPGSTIAAVRHGCFRGSRAASVPLAWANRGGAAANPVVRRADRLVAISSRAAAEFTAAGVDPHRFTVVPNFVLRADVPSAGAPELQDRWLHVGRLSPEKGLAELLRAWPAHRGLDVIGDGEQADELRAMAGPGVRFLGWRTNTEVRAALPAYAGLVVASQWPEAGPPLTYLEAISAGVPVVAIAGNGAADDVAASGTGVVVPTKPTVAEVSAAVREVETHRADLARVCRATATTSFGARSWIARMVSVYAAAASSRVEPLGRSVVTG